MNKERNNRMTTVSLLGALLVALILVFSTIFMGRAATKDTQDAVRSVSLLYLDELAGRREEVVESNLQEKIADMKIAIEMMSEEDLSDTAHLQEYQKRLRRIYTLRRFAFVDEDGLIYTADGIERNIDTYHFDYRTISEAEISIMDLSHSEKSVVIAMPVDLTLEEKKLKAAFMEIAMDELLSGVSMNAREDSATFCNIYTRQGVAMSNTVLGGLAQEDNLIEAMKIAAFEDGYSYEKFYEEFTNSRAGETSFTYNGIQETLAYVPVRGTDWLLTYLIRESVISQRISPISDAIIRRSLTQSLLTAMVLLGMFGLIASQMKRNAKLELEREKADAANRIKQEEMEEMLILKEKLLEEEKMRSRHDSMITAMASDYRSVYHVNLDHDEAICYRSDPEDEDKYVQGQHFSYYEAFKNYCEKYVDERFRQGFMDFINPKNIREGLEKEAILAYRYLIRRKGKEYYEMIRCAGVRRSEDRADHKVHEIGIGFTIIDAEMRESLAQQRALSDALSVAEGANRAKTAFLSNMSHEIRTPMNAIIGLDNIALNDPETPEKTKEYLRKIGASADHLLGLINDILDMSRIESGRMTLRHEEFSFRKLLESINTMFSSQCQDKGLNYSCSIINDVDDYYIGDDMKLRQVLINILGNAVKFTPEGGKVSMEVECTNRFDGKSALTFRIADTGIGMSKEFIPKIFETFSQEDVTSTSKYGSTGLGMPITKSIVEMMNGSIDVQSEKGKGSTFTVSVTLEDSKRKDSDVAMNEIDPSKLSVLIVDDDDVACQHGKLVLEKAGINAEVVNSGKEALKMVELRHARMHPYDLILIDWKMPEMDGIETTRRIREVIGEESAIIILTAYRWDDVLEEALKAGVDSFLAKPLFAGAVMEEFSSALDSRRFKDDIKKNKADLNNRRILVAEDVKINAEIIQMLLKSKNMESDLAENGRIALELFAKHPQGYYDAILMDMRMPEMDGLEATRKIRALDRQDAKEIPIVALTANAFDEDVQRSLQAGLNAHLSKPVSPDALFGTLETLIRDESK